MARALKGDANKMYPIGWGWSSTDIDAKRFHLILCCHLGFNSTQLFAFGLYLNPTFAARIETDRPNDDAQLLPETNVVLGFFFQIIIPGKSFRASVFILKNLHGCQFPI